MSAPMLPYPRTRHAADSALQAGDDGSDRTSMADLRALWPDADFVAEEKLDGANCGISFDPETLEMRLQSRGHFLDGGAREAQFNLLKSWAVAQEGDLLERLEDRYVMYGEWTFALHSVFYDALPHFFHEFDIWDRRAEVFLSTPARHALLAGSAVTSVPVAFGDWPARDGDLARRVGAPLYRSPDWRATYEAAIDRAARREGMDRDRLAASLPEQSDLAEGLYIKIERGGETVDRLKWVRPDFVQTIVEGGMHWRDRPIVENGLGPGVDLFAMPDIDPAP